MGYDFSIVHNHVADVFGDAATFTPVSGSPVDCRVVLRRPDAQVEFSGFPGVIESQKIRVRQSEVAAPVKGDKFIIGVKEYTVVGSPMQDACAGIWDCLVAET